MDKPTRPKRLAFVAVAVLDGACGQRVQPGARNWRSRLRLLQGSGLLVLLPERWGVLPECAELPGGVGTRARLVNLDRVGLTSAARCSELPLQKNDGATGGHASLISSGDEREE